MVNNKHLPLVLLFLRDNVSYSFDIIRLALVNINSHLKTRQRAEEIK